MQVLVFFKSLDDIAQTHWSRYHVVIIALLFRVDPVNVRIRFVALHEMAQQGMKYAAQPLRIVLHVDTRGGLHTNHPSLEEFHETARADMYRVIGWIEAARVRKHQSHAVHEASKIKGFLATYLFLDR